MENKQKSIAEIKEHLTQDISQIQDNVSTTKETLLKTSKNIADTRSHHITDIKNQAADNFKDTQQKYVDTEEKMYRILKQPYINSSSNSPNLSKEYEQVLRENVQKLRDIVQDDFETTNNNSHKLTDDAKKRVQNILANIFANQGSKNDFSKTAEAIFGNIHQMARRDIRLGGQKTDRARRSVSENIDVFVMPTKKPAEEIEAERLLQQLLTDQLLEYTEKFKNDFTATGHDIEKQVQEAKKKLNSTLQSALPKDKTVKDTPETNLPSKSDIEKNLNSVLNKAGADFQKINESMRSNVDQSKLKVAEKVKKVGEKVLGKECLGLDDD